MRKHSILLVDDDPFILTGIGQSLESEGYAVSTAENGEIALELLDRSIYDLIITDLVMDKIDGIQVLKKANAYLQLHKMSHQNIGGDHEIFFFLYRQNQRKFQEGGPQRT